jgi:hypothetical protein
MTTAGVWDAIVAASCGTAGCRKLLGGARSREPEAVWCDVGCCGGEGGVGVLVTVVRGIQHRRPAPLPRAERDETRRIAPARPNSRHTSNVVHHPRLPVQQTDAVPTCLIHMA